MTAVAVPYLAIGVVLVLAIRSRIIKSREWSWQDNLMTVVTIVFWPVLIVLGALARMLGKSGA